ncbi:MAG: hypothetical protein ACC631_01835 [Halocynthiibacter sp.]
MKILSISTFALIVAGCAAPQNEYVRGQYNTTVENVSMAVFAGATTAKVIATEYGQNVGNYRVAVLAEIEVGSRTGCRSVTVTDNTAEVSSGQTVSTITMALNGCPAI